MDWHSSRKLSISFIGYIGLVGEIDGRFRCHVVRVICHARVHPELSERGTALFGEEVLIAVAMLPVIGVLLTQSADDYKIEIVAFLQSLKGAGFVAGQNVAVEPPIYTPALLLQLFAKTPYPLVTVSGNAEFGAVVPMPSRLFVLSQNRLLSAAIAFALLN
jgi:hypothetical protein